MICVGRLRWSFNFWFSIVTVITPHPLQARPMALQSPATAYPALDQPQRLFLVLPRFSGSDGVTGYATNDGERGSRFRFREPRQNHIVDGHFGFAGAIHEADHHEAVASGAMGQNEHDLQALIFTHQ